MAGRRNTTGSPDPPEILGQHQGRKSTAPSPPQGYNLLLYFHTKRKGLFLVVISTGKLPNNNNSFPDASVLRCRAILLR